MVAVKVKAEQIRTLYRQSVTAVLTNPINALIVAAALWSTAPRSLLLGWTGMMVLVIGGRIELRRRYFRAAPQSVDAPVWGRRFVAGATLTGLCWGAGGFLLFAPTGSLGQLLLTFVIGGMSAAAAGTLSCHMPAYIGYVLPALLPLAARAFAIGDPIHTAMAAMMVVYGLGLFSVANVNHRSIREAFRFRFENEDLLGQLSRTKEELEEINRTLEQRVTERGETLRRQSEVLRDAQRLEAVGRLAGGVAHDFNNLLTVVLANLSILLSTEGLDESLRGLLVDMRDASQRGADLVRQLLVFSRRQQSTPQTMDLNQRVSAMHRLVGRLVGEHLQLKLVLLERPVWVRADPSQIEQVVVNLVTNARDAMPSGGMLTIETSLTDVPSPREGMPAGSYAVLSVSDTGEGMDTEIRARVFDPFFTTKDIGKGTGLGLATVYGIVDQSGGHITVDSRPGHGSCFRVLLPETAPPMAVDSEPRASYPPNVPAATVLLVEDEVAVRSVTQRMLKAAGHEVLVAESGEQALALAELHSGTIDLLVTDVVMGGMTGTELAERLVALRPEIRVLFISGYNRDREIPKSERYKAMDFLRKPFNFEAFAQMVASLLSAPRDPKKAPISYPKPSPSHAR
jgi:signal transduction histidine kinase/ActR/RegA family two-component response regulator